MATSLLKRALEFRRELLSRDSAAREELVRLYGEAYQRIQERLSELTREIKAARERGEEVNPFWLAQRDRLDSLLRQVVNEVERFSVHAERVITSSQMAAAGLGQAHAVELTTMGGRASVFGSFSRLNVGAVESVVGFLSDGAPLRSLLADLAPAAVARVRQSVVSGVVMGHGARKVSSQIRGDLGGNLTRALTVSRTSITNAYRASALETYRANSDLIKGWRWVCAKSNRTCLACLLMDGRVFPLERPMPAHFNCRCTFVPVLEGQEWKAQTGEAWFLAQPPEAQREMMGSRAYDLFARGEVKLSEFAGRRKDKILGEAVYRRPLSDVLNRKIAAA